MRANVISAALVSVALGHASAQSVTQNVPPAVKKAFADKYTGANHVRWDKEDGAWEASFALTGKKKSAVFTAAGKQTEEEMEISVDKLPETVRMYMKVQQKAIKEAAEITDSSGKLYYEAEAGGKDYLFNAQGRPVTKIGQ